jgi:hypothetical protein
METLPQLKEELANEYQITKTSLHFSLKARMNMSHMKKA